MMDLALDPDRAEAILGSPYRYHLTAASRLVELGVDMIRVGDDVGTQPGMMISPEMWRLTWNVKQFEVDVGGAAFLSLAVDGSLTMSNATGY